MLTLAFDSGRIATTQEIICRRSTVDRDLDRVQLGHNVEAAISRLSHFPQWWTDPAILSPKRPRLSEQQGLAKQLIMYMSKEDEQEFLDHLKSLSRLAILPHSSTTADFVALNSLPEESEDETARRFWLQNPAVNIPLATQYDEEKRLYLIDGVQSPVVELIRPRIFSDYLLPGGIQAELNYLDSDSEMLVPKPAEFRKWFEDMSSWIRKKYIHLEWLIYAGPGAEKFRQNGGKFH